MKNNDNDGYKLLALLFIGIPLSVLVSLYSTLLITKVVLWYNVPLSLTFKQWLGIDIIVTHMIMGLKSDKKQTTSETFTAIITKALVISFGFAMYYILSTLI